MTAPWIPLAFSFEKPVHDMIHRAASFLFFVTLALSACRTAATSGVEPGPGPAQTESDEYTCYDLRAYDSHKFRITHDVAATTAGARYYYAYVRGGVFLSEVKALDLHTGQRLDVDLVPGDVARENGHPLADPADKFLRVYLARPVPEGGEARLQIQVTYEDPKSYQFTGERIFFGRVLGVKRIAVVLPPRFDLVSVNHPAQVVVQSDGRVRASLINTAKSALALEIVAQRAGGTAAAAADAVDAADELTWNAIAPASFAVPGVAPESSTPRRASALVERAHQDREVVWTLGDPASGTFVMQREFTQSGADTYHWVDVVHEPRRVSNTLAIALDTGASLHTEILTLGEALERGFVSGTDAADASQIVAVQFEPLTHGATLRLRIDEELTDPDRYTVDGEELVFVADLADARGRVVLPKGFYPIESAVPASVVEQPDGRIALEFVNATPRELELSIKARGQRAAH